MRPPCLHLYRLFMTIFAHILGLGGKQAIKDEGKGILSYFVL